MVLKLLPGHSPRGGGVLEEGGGGGGDGGKEGVDLHQGERGGGDRKGEGEEEGKDDPIIETLGEIGR